MILSNFVIWEIVDRLTGYGGVKPSKDSNVKIEEEFANRLGSVLLGRNRPEGDADAPHVVAAYVLEALQPTRPDTPKFTEAEKAMLLQVLAHVAL